jgi:microcystin-dependent protein
MAWGTNTPPANWLIADGAAVSRTVYSSLFAVIGTTYGTGDGSTTFNLPNLSGRVPVGKNGGTFGTLAGTGGAETNTLTANNLPAHTHPITDPGHSHYNGARIGGGSSGWGTVVNAGYTGGADQPYWYTGGSGTGITVNNNSTTNSAVNNLQPYLVLNYIIKASAGWTAGDSELATRVGALETADATTNKSGLVPIIPTSVSAISSGSASVGANGIVSFTGTTAIQLNGVFTSAFTNYRVLVNHEASTAMNVGVRFGTSGTRYTGTGYQVMAGYATPTGTFAGWTGQDQSYLQTGSTNSVPGSATLSADVMNPFLAAKRTVLNFQASGWSGAYRGVFGSGLEANETSRTDISYESTAGTISGTIQVYGYR